MCVDVQLFEEAKIVEIPDIQNYALCTYVAVLFDDVEVKEDLVNNRHSGG